MMALSATVSNSSRDPGSRALRTHLYIIHTAKGITHLSLAGYQQHSAQDICTAAAGVRLALRYTGCCGVLWLWMTWPALKDHCILQSPGACWQNQHYSVIKLSQPNPKSCSFQMVVLQKLCTCLCGRCLFCLEPWEELC